MALTQQGPGPWLSWASCPVFLLMMNVLYNVHTVSMSSAHVFF